MGIISGNMFGDVNCNGVFTPGVDQSIEGALVVLKDAATNNIIATTATNSSSFYQFNVANGTYYIEFIKPSSYLNNQFILQGIGISVVSQNFSAYGRSSNFINGSGGNTNVNAPLIIPQTLITGTVYQDTNCNGILDTSEPVISNVPVSINVGGAIGTAITNTSGVYQYTLTTGGTAVLTFPSLVDKTYSPLGADASANACGQVVIPAITPNYTTCTPQVLNYNQGYCQATRCIKGCVYLQCGCCGSGCSGGGCSSCSTCSGGSSCGSLTGGSTCCGIQGYPNMFVQLCDANKAPINGTTTDECGCYSFCDLDNAVYYVKFLAPKCYKIISGNVKTTTFEINAITATAQVYSSSVTVNGVGITLGMA